MLKMLKSLLPDARLTFGKAITCVLINQLAMPGAGSLVGGRLLAGTLQMLASVTGFVLGIVWFMKLMASYYALTDVSSSVVPVDPDHYSLGMVGAGLFGFSWLWALVTSCLILRQAGQLDHSRIKPPPLPQRR